jgi:hypothetical protein
MIDENEKEGIIVIAEIDAADAKLPFTVVGKEKHGAAWLLSIRTGRLEHHITNWVEQK